MPLQPQILGHLLLGVSFQQLLQRFPRPSLEIAPKAFLQVPYKRFKPLCVILDSHRGVGSFTGDFVALTTKPTPSFFLHNQIYVTWIWCLKNKARLLTGWKPPLGFFVDIAGRQSQ